jgi:hypothetical protein
MYVPTFVNCSFESNYGGGQMGADVSSSAVMISGGSFSNCTFDNNNNAQGYGGAVYSSGNGGYACFFASCRFSTNTAKAGGAVSLPLGLFVFANCSFTGNTAGEGGALYLGSRGSGSVTNCTFDGNIVTSGSGGAILLANGGTLPFVDCMFINNVGGHGGALFASANTVATFAGCHFVASAVTTKGNNDIARFSTTTPRGLVEFICPANSTGASVMMKPDDLLVTQLPPQQQIVHCTP